MPAINHKGMSTFHIRLLIAEFVLQSCKGINKSVVVCSARVYVYLTGRCVSLSVGAETRHDRQS